MVHAFLTMQAIWRRAAMRPRCLLSIMTILLACLSACWLLACLLPCCFLVVSAWLLLACFLCLLLVVFASCDVLLFPCLLRYDGVCSPRVCLFACLLVLVLAPPAGCSVGGGSISLRVGEVEVVSIGIYPSTRKRNGDVLSVNGRRRRRRRCCVVRCLYV